MKDRIFQWARGNPYWADHVYLYLFSIGTTIAAVILLMQLALDTDHIHSEGNAVYIPDSLEVAGVLLFGIGGLLTARGIRIQKLPLESSGLVLMATGHLNFAIVLAAHGSDFTVALFGAACVASLARCALILLTSKVPE